MKGDTSTAQADQDTWWQKVCKKVPWETVVISLLGVIILCLATWGATAIILGSVELQLEDEARSILIQSSQEWQLCPRRTIEPEVQARQINASQVQAYYVMRCENPGLAYNRTWKITADMVARLAGRAHLACQQDLLYHRCYNEVNLKTAYHRDEEVVEYIGRVNMTETDECYLNVVLDIDHYSEITSSGSLLEDMSKSNHKFHDILMLPNLTFVIRWLESVHWGRYNIEVQLRSKDNGTHSFRDLADLLTCNEQNLQQMVVRMLSSEDLSETYGRGQHIDLRSACGPNTGSKISLESIPEDFEFTKYACTKGVSNEYWTQWQDALALAKARARFPTLLWPTPFTYDGLIGIWSAVLGALFSGVLTGAAVFVYAIFKCCWIAIEPACTHSRHMCMARRCKHVSRGLKRSPRIRRGRR